MKTGIVFQIEGRRAVILKGDGAFVSVNAKRGWKVGETVPITSAAQNHVKALAAAAACFTVLALGGLGLGRVYAAPVLLISLDVNPSIELGVNRWGRVVSTEALNEEGAEILNAADPQNAVYQDAFSSILSAEGESGYLISGSNVVFTVFASDAAMQSDVLSELQSVVDAKVPLYSDKIIAEYHAVDEQTVNGAHGHGVTAGKYLYLQELQALEPETDLSQYTHHSIEQIKGEIEACGQKHGETARGSHHGEPDREEGHRG